MKAIATALKPGCLALLALLVCAPLVHAQFIYGDTTDLKREMSDLRSQVQQLTNLVHQMRNTILETATGSCPPELQQAQAKPGETAKPQDTARPQQAAKETPPVDEEHLTKLVCKSVGEFFPEAEAALSLSDPDAARAAMIKALQKLTTKLHGYAGTHRVNKLLGIYEGLAWDTYTAVQLRQSIEGNTAFLEKLRQHKRKYQETCPSK